MFNVGCNILLSGLFCLSELSLFAAESHNKGSNNNFLYLEVKFEKIFGGAYSLVVKGLIWAF